MSSIGVVLIAILLLVVLLVLGVPIPFAFSGVTIALVLLLGYSPDFLIPASYNNLNSLVLCCIPLFILAGSFIREGKIGDALIGFVEQFVGRISSGLGIVTVFVCGIFGAISGSAAATLSAVGSIMAPKLQDRGYDTGQIAALLASSSVLGILIPPSAAQILYAWSSGASVLACFLSTITPAIILAILLCIVQHFQVRKRPEVQNREYEKLDMHIGPIAKRTGYALPALFMPVLVLGGIYGGFMTTMEAAAVAVLYCVPIAIFFYKGMKAKNIFPTIIDAGYNSGAIAMMLMSCAILSRIFTTEHVPDMLVRMTLGITDNKVIILLMLNIVMVILGMLMDDGSAIVLSTPLLLPIAVSIGINPIHYAAIMGVNLGMGLVTPPCAPMLFLGSSVAKSPASKAFKPTMQFILFAWLPTLILTTFIPNIALWLPKLVMGI
ncbi:MAG: TRAP transporter large permease [Eubacterium sp.]|nr:TRAP transporter large permease [Candidatus Colimonas fimequi]